MDHVRECVALFHDHERRLDLDLVVSFRGHIRPVVPDGDGETIAIRALRVSLVLLLV